MQRKIKYWVHFSNTLCRCCWTGKGPNAAREGSKVKRAKTISNWSLLASLQPISDGFTEFMKGSLRGAGKKGSLLLILSWTELHNLTKNNKYFGKKFEEKMETDKCGKQSFQKHVVEWIKILLADSNTLLHYYIIN